MPERTPAHLGGTGERMPEQHFKGQHDCTQTSSVDKSTDQHGARISEVQAKISS